MGGALYWTAKKLLDLYYILRGTETPADALDDAGLPVEPDLAVQEERLRAAKIDGEDFEFFYAHYYHRIYRFCFNRIRRRDVAEDLVAETFLKAYANLDRYRWTGVRFGSWLYRIARNELIRWVEREKKRQEDPLPTNVLGEDLLMDTSLDPELRLQAAQERRLLDRYLSQLDPEDQIWL